MIYSMLAGFAAICIFIVAMDCFYYSMPGEGLIALLLAAAAVWCI